MLGLFRSRKSLGGRLLAGGGRGWILLCTDRLCRRRRRIARRQHGDVVPVQGTHILVDTEHFKVYRLGPLVIVEDIIRRDIESPWLLMLRGQ